MICFPLVARETTSRAAALYLFLRFFQLYLITTILDYVVGNAVVVLGKLSSVNMPGYRGFVTAGSQGRGVSGLSSPAWSRTMLLSPGPISKALASSLVIKLQKCWPVMESMAVPICFHVESNNPACSSSLSAEVKTNSSSREEKEVFRGVGPQLSPGSGSGSLRFPPLWGFISLPISVLPACKRGGHVGTRWCGGRVFSRRSHLCPQQGLSSAVPAGLLGQHGDVRCS